ncbi:DUF3854 domain-containing protein [Fibrella sp. USSR17]
MAKNTALSSAEGSKIPSAGLSHENGSVEYESSPESVAVSYCERRLLELGITPTLNTVMVEHDCFDSPASMHDQLFRANAQDGIDILYVGLNGLKTFQKGRKELPYRRVRINPLYCQRIDAPKYITPKGASTELFIPPMILTAYERQETINSLFITEGEFKAMKASIHGLHCVGSQGIHNITEKDGQGNRILNTELELLVKVCRVKNLVLLFDNDCLTVTYEPDKDLWVRPNSFFSAVKNFRELTKHLSCDVYFQHINVDLASKGIDDLLCSMQGHEAKIVNDMLAINKPIGKFVYTLNLTEKGLKSLKSYFHITSVEDFYAEYEETLTDQKFRYQGYYHQHNGTELKNLISDQVTRYLRVGDEYFEHIEKPDRMKRLVPQLDKRAKQTIIDDYGRGALEHIPKYKSFCLVPSHHDYQQIVSQCYNSYYKMNHIPMPGSIEQSLAMVRHIFKDKYEFGLDYLQLLYMQPGQLLPILLLQSKERNTGKSTFGQWQIEIFQSNAVKLGNADLENDFNSTYAEKLLVVVDETALAKKSTSEAIKRMSTEQGKVFVNAKNRQQYETEWIGKFIFITNTLNTAMFIGKGEMRYFVRTIDALPGGRGSDDPDMLEKLREEIPAFLHFLQNRTLHHPRKGRMYFDFGVYETSELVVAIDANKSTTEREILQLLEDTFNALPDLAELRYGNADIAAELKDRTTWKVSETDIRKCLKEELNMKLDESGRYIYHSLKASLIDNSPDVSQKRNGRHYTFKRSRFRP